MRIPLRYAELIKASIKKAGGSLAWSKEHYDVDNDDLLEHTTIEELATVKKMASKDMDAKVAGSGPVYRDFRELERRSISLKQMKQAKMGSGYDPTAIQVYDLKTLATLLKDAIEKTSENRWIYIKIKDYLFTPVFVSKIEHKPHSSRQREAVVISMNAVTGRATPQFCSNTKHIYEDIFGKVSYALMGIVDDDEETAGTTQIIKSKPARRSKGISLEAVLRKSLIFLSTPALEAEYLKNYAAYASLADTCGQQFVAIDPTIEAISTKDDDDAWWRYTQTSTVSLTYDGVPSKLIVDDVDEENYGGQFSGATGFSIRDTENDVGEDWDIKNPKLPTMPVVRFFNLQTDSHCFVAASSIKPYAYDTEVWNKLILPKHDMDFVQMLLASNTVNISDIVAGKAKGIIVICSGAPGLGKTLTAEAASEAFEKPFYSVQCSQLGIDPETLEKSLLLALARAVRWGAILLLDEADVYVRRRGDDLEQNAIVGVFLRVLEYYRGILFMTTNLGNDIDDAILSRATAHLNYELPALAQLPELWQVLATQFQVNLSVGDIKELIKHFGSIPGRSIRNLIKLTKFMAVSRKEKPSVAMVVDISRYLDVGKSAR